MRPLNLPLLALAAALVLPAADFWNTTESDLWSEAEIKKMVTDSPWAVEAGSGEARIIARWESAVPVREACAKGGMERYLFSCTSKLMYVSGLSKKFEEFAKDYYIVSLSNYPKMPPPSNGAAEPPQHSAAANAALQQMGERIQQATFLRRVGKGPVLPEHVLVLPTGQTVLVIFFFPRTQAIGLEDKEVLLQSAGESVKLECKFHLTNMVYKGKLEL